MFNNKRVLVTGGTRGIGKAVAQKLLQLEAKVYITGSYQRNGWWENHENCVFIAIDFSKEHQEDLFFSELIDHDFEMLVNAAGIFIKQPLADATHNDLFHQLNVNLTSPIGLIKSVLPGMQKRNFGRIVNITSIAASLHRPGSSLYSSSKAALLTFTRAMALELAPSDILINAISPGYTDTDMMDNLTASQKQGLINNVPLERLCKPDEVADAVLFLLAPKNKYITGHNLIIDGGVTLKQ